MMKKSDRINALRYRHTTECCGRKSDWLGPTPQYMYICRACQKEMVPVQREVRTLAACELIDLHQRRFNGEVCADCGTLNSHHVRFDAELDAYFLDCGRCGEELREIEKKELAG